MSNFPFYTVFFGDRIPRKLGLIVVFVSCTLVSIPFLFSLSAIIQTILIVFIRFVLGKNVSI